MYNYLKIKTGESGIIYFYIKLKN